MGRTTIPQSVRDAVFAKTGGACYYCGDFATDLDHILPYSYNQDNSEKNLVACCRICNSIAHNRIFDTLHAKAVFIMERRKTRRWQRKLARMVKVIITVNKKHIAPESIPPNAIWEPKLQPKKRKPPKPLRRSARIIKEPRKYTPRTNQEALQAAPQAGRVKQHGPKVMSRPTVHWYTLPDGGRVTAGIGSRVTVFDDD